MRIIFLLPIADLSGGNRVVSIYAKALENLGHEITIITLPRRQSLTKYLFSTVSRYARWPQQKPYKTHLDGLGLDVRVLDSCRPIESADIPPADVVIATWWETAEWLARVERSKGAKAYFIQHHEIFDYLPVARAKATYKLPLHKIVIANWLKDVMAKEYNDSSVDIVPNSVDQEQFHAPIRSKQIRPTVGFLFSNAEFKGVDVTLSAIRQLRRRFPSLRIVSFGTSAPQKSLDWDSSIEFELSPPQYRLRELYAQCDVWITASRSEGFNLPAMEAMACRTPVVATRTGWPEEAICDKRNGFLVEIDDAVAIFERSSEILMLNANAWQDMSLDAFKTATSGSWEKSTMLFEAALTRCVQRTAHREI